MRRSDKAGFWARGGVAEMDSNRRLLLRRWSSQGAAGFPIFPLAGVTVRAAVRRPVPSERHSGPIEKCTRSKCQKHDQKIRTAIECNSLEPLLPQVLARKYNLRSGLNLRQTITIVSTSMWHMGVAKHNIDKHHQTSTGCNDRHQCQAFARNSA